MNRHAGSSSRKGQPIDAPRDRGGFDALDSLPRGPRPTLLRRFTLLSLATTIAVGILFGVITARLVENFAIRRQARATAVRVLEIVRARLTSEDLRLAAPSEKTKFARTMGDLAGRGDIVDVTVWNATLQVVYGNPHLTPEGTPSAALIRRALEGQLQWRLVPGRGAPVLEVFVPVMVAGSPAPVGVYQVSSDLTDLAPALARLIWSVQISVVLGVLALYAVLFSIVRAASWDLERKESALRWAFVGIIRSLVNALDARDMATGHHSSRVAEDAVSIARTLGLDEDAVNEVQIAAFLHDVGKIGIRDDLLTKAGPLTREERAIMQQHSVLGYEILDPVAIPAGIKLAVRHSHERWDGRGYPDGLAGDRIPLGARIIAVADAYEALTTDRPYRAAQSPDEALEEIRLCAGTQFDPRVVEAALRVWAPAAAECDPRSAVDSRSAVSERVVRPQTG